MPKSRKNKRRKPQSSNRPPKLELTSFKPSGEGREAFRAAIQAAATAGVDDFPRTLEAIVGHFGDHHPPSIIASAAMYSLQSFVGSDGKSKRPSRDIEQHHVELLQAVMLTVPAEEWGLRPLTADVMQSVFDHLPELARTFLYQRLVAAQNVEDDQAKDLLSLQERIRLHTQAVRNWGYYQDVIAISKEIHGPLDQSFTAAIGFGVTDLIEVMATLIKEYERRANEHIDILRKVLRGATVRELAKLYYKYVPDLKGSPEELLAAIPPGVSREGMMSYIMQHLDLRLSDRATFTAEEIAALSGRPPEIVDKILRSVSRLPGELAGANPDHLFLANPVWTAPGIVLPEGGFLFAIPQVVFSHIHAIVHGLAEKAGLTEALERRRARYLEAKLEGIIRNALPGATISSGVEWQVGEEQGETDVLAVLDRVVLIAEAKSHRLTPQALRGAPDRMRKHIRDLVVDPSLQSARLESFISAARNGDGDALALMKRLGIDPTIADHIIRLSVTLDDLSILTANEAELKSVGWVPADHHLAPTIHVTDLACITDILTNPLLLLHYLGERAYFQKTFELMGDELDFLGLYLLTLFNLGGLEAHERMFAPSGMSAPVDQYYDARDAGIVRAKPTVHLQPYFRTILERLSDRRPPGWTLAGMFLLGSADPCEQRSIENALNKLRVSVRKNFHTPDHLNSIIVKPPASRKALVIFYLFPEQRRADVKKVMEHYAAEALEDKSRPGCVVFARCIDNWGAPYEVVLLAQQNAD